MKNRILTLARWLFFEPRFVWLCAAVLAIAAMAATIFGFTERSIRLTGLALQMAGIVTVAWGILSTRAFFGLPPARNAVRDWWRRRPFRKLHSASGTLSAGFAVVSATGAGYASYKIDPDLPVSEALQIIQKNLELVHQRVSDLQAETLDRHKRLQSVVNDHTDRIAKVRDELSNQVKTFGTSGLHISAIGAVWLFAGAVMGAASPELQSLLQ
jgi:hypothetical protein